MKKFIIRTEDAGVYYGEIEEINGTQIRLKNARMLRYWSGAFTLLEMSLYGVTKPEQCQFTDYVKEITLNNWITTLPCTDEAIESIEGVKVWKI